MVDLLVPVVGLIVCCMVGMIYSGGYFGEDNPGFVKAFSDSDASVGLAFGSIVAIVFAVAFYLCRRVISFKDCMDAFPEGFKAMVPAIMILCCAWTLKAMTDSLGAKVFISDIINGPTAGLLNFLPAIIFVIAIFLAFSTSRGRSSPSPPAWRAPCAATTARRSRTPRSWPPPARSATTSCT